MVLPHGRFTKLCQVMQEMCHKRIQICRSRSCNLHSYKTKMMLDIFLCNGLIKPSRNQRTRAQSVFIILQLILFQNEHCCQGEEEKSISFICLVYQREKRRTCVNIVIILYILNLYNYHKNLLSPKKAHFSVCNCNDYFFLSSCIIKGSRVRKQIEMLQ